MKSHTKRDAVGVKVSGLGKRFGTQIVLDGIDFEVKPGETFVIMGPSGSGKSVLLKTMIGLASQDRGNILIDGHDTQDPQTFRKKETSMVFQAGALFNSMNVYDNLAFYPREHRISSKKEIDEQVRKTLSILSLDNAANKYPSELSGGMRKRVSIARSLMMRPQLLLYDEPTSELDPIMGATISEIIGTLNEQFNVTSVVVSHDVHLAKSIADTVAIMFDGKFRVVRKPGELSSVDDPQVQEFLNPDIDIKNPRFRKLNAK
jgi:phospholipid/cholesterol/gamma-HCH transport system ATP-binding protein